MRVENAEAKTCGASVQNVQCTKAGEAGGKNIWPKTNIWEVAVTI